MENQLRDKKLFLLDMDGTLYLGDRVYEGTLEFLSLVRERGGRYMYLTNNSSRSVESYVEKLTRLGIPAKPEDFFTSAEATIRYLRGQGLNRPYVLGTESLRERFRQTGFTVYREVRDEVDCLVMGFDTELTFQKLEDACILLKREIPYIATNPDWVCPTEYGSVPDCGSVAQMLKNATGRLPLFIGKPEPAMAEQAMALAGCTREETALIGDRLYTDIACGLRAGISSVFVLSGEGTMEDIEKMGITPTHIFQDIKSVAECLK